MNTYEEIFNQRGYKYDQAMAAFPKARDQEFYNLINQFKYSKGTVIADIPAGGEYMKCYLPEYCHYVGFEPCRNFKRQNITEVSDFFPLPIEDHSIDITFSLAGLHHLEDKAKLFSEFKRITKPSGYLGIADVYAGSATSKFLDNFIGQHNEMGHKGIYLSELTLDELTQAGWNLMSAKRTNLHWVFADKEQMGMFCKRLFDISCSQKTIVIEIENQLGIESLPGNLIGMNWELYTIFASTSL